MLSSTMARRRRLALQLHSAFEVSFAGCGLVGSSPRRPGDHERRLDPTLGKTGGHPADLLERPVDEQAWRRVTVFGGAMVLA